MLYWCQKTCKKTKILAHSLLNEINRRPFVASFFVFLFFLVLSGIIYFTVDNVSSRDDQFFHFKLAYLFRTEGWQVISNFKWLYFTNLAQHNLSYGFTLYHYFLIPFTLFPDKIFGLKLVGAVFPALVYAIYFFVFRKLNVKNAFLWTVIIFAFSSYNFTWRMFTGRNFVFINGLLILEIYLIHKNKYNWLFLVALIHTWWHPGTFWIVPMFVIVYEAMRYINQYKIYYYNLLAGFIGSLLGFVLMPSNSDHLFAKMNPWDWSIRIARFLSDKMTGKLVTQSMEGNARDIFSFAAISDKIFILLIFFLVISIILYIYRKRNNNCDLDKNLERVILREFIFVIIIIFFLGNIYITLRFEDLLVPAILLGVVVIFQFLSEKNIFRVSERIIKSALIIAGFTILSFYFVNRVLDIRQNIGSNKDYLAYEKVGQWLKENTNKHEIIFNTSWDQFPRLFFYDDWNYYIFGIDPESLYSYNKELYWLWFNISNYGILCNDGDCSEKVRDEFTNKNEEDVKKTMVEHSNDIYPIIKEKFMSKYVFFDGDTTLKKELEENPEKYQLVYEDKPYGIFVYLLK